MGILDGLMGNSSTVSKDEVSKSLKEVLFPGEEVQQAYKLIRDMIVFTGNRLILVDIQGMTGKKIEYHSIPYKSITHFSTETAGTFDLDAELKIWLSGADMPITKTFKKGNSIEDVQKLLAYYVCG
ncbi:PH domain-containing protein [Pradoshia sp. D12]|uniref:PH domain-containing protein n=1 Tax=Bacillaceae TaxID=186817 RepID=UPI00111EC536|nr:MULTISPECIES: PH domain-containing protein [Bacillaceae]QFK71459.1 PH domain-containing protein [Pradoshia sp. D12]TPF73254.1 PH domain-containing protein [Bacillus sp. D12]